MSEVSTFLRIRLVSLVVALFSAPLLLAFAQIAPPDLEEAQRLIDRQAWEQAIPLLDRLIPQLDQSRKSGQDLRARDHLAQAYLLRSRAQLGLSNMSAAELDLKSSLQLLPGQSFTEPSPVFSALFERIKRENVGELAIALTPRDAEVRLDEQLLTLTGEPIQLTKGTHTLSARRPGYTEKKLEIAVPPGERFRLSISLDRTSSVVELRTIPAGVEVLIDGVSKGETKPNGNDVTPSSPSSPLIIEGVRSGVVHLDFRAPCYRPHAESVNFAKHDDYRLDPVVLAPALGEIVVTSEQPNATVSLDGVPRDITTAIKDVCAGPHIVEFRTPDGRDLKRVVVRAGQREEIRGNARPAFALVPEMGRAEDNGPVWEIRRSLERKLAGLQGVALLALSGATLEAAMLKAGVGPSWRQMDAIDRTRQDLTVSAMERLKTGYDLSTALDIQGIAIVMESRDPSADEATLAILAKDSGVPDFVPIPLDADWKIDASFPLDGVPILFTHTIDVTAVDIVNRNGAEVVEVVPGSAAAQAGMRVGDVITAVGDERLTGRGAFFTLLNAQPSGKTVAFSVQRGPGAIRVEIPVRRVPHLAASNDRTVLFNVQLVQLRALARKTSDPLEQAVVHLQTAVALIYGRNWSAALTELDQANLPPGPGVSGGTVHYLKGQCYQELGQNDSAVREWREAAKDQDSRLTPEGPLIRDLVQEKLRGASD